MSASTNLPDLPPRSHFTCTLGEAEILNNTLPSAPYSTINEFLDYLALKFSGNIAVGCAQPGNQQSKSPSESWVVETLTFAELHGLSRILSSYLSSRVDSEITQRTVALYASSSLVYLIYFFAWLRCGWKVVLISTSCNSNAVRHLLKSCGATAICCDLKHGKVVDEALATDKTHQVDSVLKIELEYSSLEDVRQLTVRDDILISAQKATDIVLYGHSSGTSTGLPKPIPITHQDEIGALPRYHQVKTLQRLQSTFSTTPIYTGGLADLWRSWSAGTTLWTYAENIVPITAENILRYKTAVQTWIGGNENSSPIGYISCVPYVAQLMAEHADLLEWLQSVESIGVGGATMPVSLGDMLVNNDVNLISRLGSRECGFLLSSAREYAKDKEWQYLRHDIRVNSILFKRWNETDYELLIEQTWPSLSPAIRGKTPFNSHDIFIPHRSIRNAWKYNGRSDVQIALVTGKKFDPAGIESALVASEWIKDAVVIGSGRHVPAAITFASTQAESLSTKECRNRILKAILEVNRGCPTHARLRNNMIAILPSNKALLIQKSSKGTIMRGKFAEDFTDVIQQLYAEDPRHNEGAMLNTLNEEELVQEISTIVANESGMELDRTSPGFYEAGIDSAMSLQIRNRIRARLPVDLQGKVALNAVYDTGNVQALTALIQSLGNQLTNGLPDKKDDTCKRKMEIDSILNRVRVDNKQSQESLAAAAEISTNSMNLQPANSVILMTGATGFLGAHLLMELVLEKRIQKIICLVRRSSRDQPQTEAQNRVRHNLSSYGLEIPRDNESKISYIFSSLDKPDLGLEINYLRDLLPQITHVVHAAWAVNFSLPLKTFDSQLHGLLNLYNLVKRLATRRRPIKFVFVSSTASVLEASSPVLETLSRNNEDCSDSGYGKSKWAAETLLAELALQDAQLEISVLRVGQLTANSKTGIWNLREAWPLMLDAGFNIIPHRNEKVILPDLSGINGNQLDWLPVDLAAETVVDLLLDNQIQDSVHIPKVFHVLYNAASMQTWVDVKSWLSAPLPVVSQCGTEHVEIEFVSPDRWLDLLEAEGEIGRKHPALSLVPLWRNGWKPVPSPTVVQKFSTLHAEQRSKAIRKANSSNETINREAFLGMLKWLVLQNHAD